MADALVGLVVIGLAVPLVLKRVPMNRSYGVRISKAFESEVNWYAVNFFGGWVLIASGVLICLLGVALIVRPPRLVLAVVLSSCAPVPIVLLSLVPIFLYAKRLGQ